MLGRAIVTAIRRRSPNDRSMAILSRTAASLRALALDLCKASRVLDSAEANLLLRLVEVARVRMNRFARQLVRSAGVGAVLQMWFSDGTPMRTAVQYRDKGDGGENTEFRRHGRSGREFLLMRGYVKTLRHGRCQIAPIVTEPLPMTKGKSVWHIFSATVAQVLNLPASGHTNGINISFYCFDRAIFSTMMRRLQARHRLAFDRSSAGIAAAPQDLLLECQNWCCGVACALHDGMNALRWATTSYLSAPKDAISDLFVGIESLRNSFDTLVGATAQFVATKLEFRKRQDDPERVREFWLLMDVDPAYMDKFISLNLWWDGQKLLADAEWESRDDACGEVATCILYLMKFRAFSDSRWTTMGPSARSLLRCLSVGLHHIVISLLSDPSVSKFYLGGYKKLNEELLHFCAITACVGRVADAFILSCLEDDRVALRSTHLMQEMQIELEYLWGLSDFVWNRLSELCGGRVGPNTLKTQVVFSSLSVIAFIDDKVLREVRALPWSLCVDTPTRLEQLRGIDINCLPNDTVTRGVKRMLTAGVPLSGIQTGIALLAECQWSTRCVEQGHGSMACIKKLHQEYTAPMLTSRAALHQQRALFAKSPADAQAERLDRRIRRQSARQPHKISGRHVFLADMYSQAREVLPLGRDLRNHERLAIVRAHGAAFANLPLAARMAYDRRAERLAEDRRSDQLAELEHLRAQCVLMQERSVEEKSLALPMCDLGQCRYSEADLQEMAEMMEEPSFQTALVVAGREALLAPPEAPPLAEQELLEEVAHGMAKDSAGARPPWLPRVTALRDHLRHCALLTQGDPAVRVWQFLHATKSPQRVLLCPMSAAEPTMVLPAGLYDVNLDALADEIFQFVFEVDTRKFVTEQDLPFDEAALFVLPDLYVKGAFVVSVADLVPLTTWLAAHRDVAVAAPPPEGGRAVSRPKVSKGSAAHLLKEHPWLRKHMTRPQLPIDDSAGACAAQGDEADLEADSDAEDLVSLALHELEDRRAQWVADSHAPADAFEVIVRGGAWLARTKGVAYDEFRAQPRTPQAKLFCRRYGFNQSFAAAIARYTEAVASQLAAAWAHKLEFFLSRWVDSGDGSYEFSRGEVDAYVERPTFTAMALAADPAGPTARRVAEIRALGPKKPLA